jgi:endoglucanase
MESRALAVARKILSQPTATFLEHRPAAAIRELVRACPGLQLREDAAGNLLVMAGDPGAKTPLILMAHLDHPGFAVDRVEGDIAHLTFRGGVRLAHARARTPLAFFHPRTSQRIGRGLLLKAEAGEGDRSTMLASGQARISQGRAQSGGFTMWDFPGWSLREGRIVSRCLDDLLGAAAGLAALQEIHLRKLAGVQVWGLFTRAEEVGFFGAFEAIRLRTVPKMARVLSLETSRALPHAPQGGGVIVRVGDARSLFDPCLSAVLHDAAKELAAQDPSFRFQRKLMDGGSCEATPFCAAGYHASGVALPLGNYHNMAGLDGGKKGIGAEHVMRSDYLSMVKLLVRLGEISSELPSREKATTRSLARLAAEAKTALARAPRLTTP